MNCPESRGRASFSARRPGSSVKPSRYAIMYDASITATTRIRPAVASKISWPGPAVCHDSAAKTAISA
ncbi:MAG: hypothetical protein AUH41_08005 [Gemmatimonadetes bacterium 13_1_40CM_66_11]|nr:MAG: hypothetical protein AUH41_08005 [Gemmatimonadetes bacterium 13_1_40CM_66_11]